MKPEKFEINYRALTEEEGSVSTVDLLLLTSLDQALLILQTLNLLFSKISHNSMRRSIVSSPRLQLAFF